MAGYWQRPDETAKVMTPDGYFKTGDVGVVDARGFFKIVDRKKDMILVSGFNVFPTELEDVVAQMPGIMECACVGVPDAKSGEAVKLVIDKKADVEFARPVKARAVEIHGKMVADINCDGCLSISSGGSLVGVVHAKAINIEKGGIFSGELAIGQEEEPPPEPIVPPEPTPVKKPTPLVPASRRPGKAK